MGIFTNTADLVTLSMNMMRILAAGYIAMAIIQSLSGVMGWFILQEAPSSQMAGKGDLGLYNVIRQDYNIVI